MFGRFLEYIALSGLGVCAAVLGGYYLSHLSKRIRVFARRYGVIGLLAIAFFGFAAITEGPPDNDYKDAVQDALVGDGETNALFGAMLMAAPRRMLPIPSTSTSNLNLDPYRLVYVVTNEVYDYTMPTNATEYSPWRLRGAAEDWFKLDLGNWRFPMGTNDYSVFRVFTDGTIRPKLHSTNDTISAIGAAMSAIPDVSRFWYSVGANYSRILTWENFVMGRVPNSSFNLSPPPFTCAQIQLFPSGDYIVRSNNVERLYRYIDPFDWPEYLWGQSDADKAYIDATVGTNLENGYYKLTVTVPPSVGRRTLITVGYQQLVADKPGEYAFLLEKGEEYQLSLEPFAPDITYEAVDDIRPPLMGVKGMFSGVSERFGHWSVDDGVYTLRYPSFFEPGLISWMPRFYGSPDVPHIWVGSDRTFTAILNDYIYPRWVSYHWICDDDNVHIESPYSRNTRISFGELPSWRETALRVTATIGTNELVSVLRFSYGFNALPQTYLVLSLPDPVVLNGKRRKLEVEFSSDQAIDDGMLHLRCVQGQNRIRLWSSQKGGLPVSFEQDWECDSFDGFECYVEGTNTSASVDDVIFQLDYVSKNGETNSVSSCLTVVDFISEPISSYQNTFDPEEPYMNPCAIKSGRPEAFWALLLPKDTPASWLTWHAKSGNAIFPEGNVGRIVLVDSSSSELVLEARINDYDDEPDPILFKVDVIQEDN